MTYTDDTYTESWMAEYAAEADAREAATERDLRAARHIAAEPWYKTHVNKPYTPHAPRVASTYDEGDVVLTRNGPVTIADARYVEATASWVYAVTDRSGSRWIQDHKIIGKAL